MGFGVSGVELGGPKIDGLDVRGFTNCPGKETPYTTFWVSSYW